MRGVRFRAYERVRQSVFFPVKTRSIVLAEDLPTEQPVLSELTGDLRQDVPPDLPTDSPTDLNLLRHELRTPLTGLLGLAELMSVMELPGRLPFLLATLQACGQQMASLIDRKLKPEPRVIAVGSADRTDLRGLLEEVICSHWPAAHAARIKLHLVLQPESSGLWLIDSVAMRQALDNLLANAIRFSGSGYVTLEARVIAGEALGLHSLQLVVEDSGAAWRVLENNLQDCAEFADRTYPMTTRGQGLQVVEQVCSSLGGRLDRYSNSPGGTGFAMLLPGVIRCQHEGIKPFQTGLFRQLSCVLLLEAPSHRVVKSMLDCLEIDYEAIDNNQLVDISGLPAWQVVLCNPVKMSLRFQTPTHDADPASLWLVAPIHTAQGTEVYAQQLPEPLFQADLQTALLRCLVMQGQANERADKMANEPAA